MAVLERLSGAEELSAQELREQVPELAGRLDLAPGKSYGANVPVAPRVLTQLGVEGEIVRGRNGGHWRTSRPRWARMDTWLGEVPAALKADEGYAELVSRWLATLRARHRRRPAVVARWHGHRGPRRARRPSVRSRSRSRTARSAGCCP